MNFFYYLFSTGLICDYCITIGLKLYSYLQTDCDELELVYESSACGRKIISVT